MSMNARLRALRNDKGFSLRQLEARTGISNSYLNQLENERIRAVSAEKLYKIARELGVSMEYLLTGIAGDGKCQDCNSFRASVFEAAEKLIALLGEPE